MPTGTHATFPLDLQPSERAAGFTIAEIDNPSAQDRAHTPRIWALVCPVDETNRVVKRRADNGDVVYQHRRCDRSKPAAGDATFIPEWRNVFLPFLDPATAVRIANINRAMPEPEAR